jgi:hypothetical protein
LDFSGKVVMLPTGVTQVGDLDFKALLEFRSFVEDEFSVKCGEKLFGCFLFSFFLAVLFFGIFLEFLFTFFMPLPDLSAVVFSLVFIQ